MENLLAFIEAVERVRRKGLFFTSYLNCEITYSGRAEAFLPRGDRMIVLKQDGVLLIHQPVNGSPINYLKSGCSIDFTIEEDNNSIILNAKSFDGKEFLDIIIFDVYDMMFQKLDDGQKQDLAGNEADMSDMIRDKPKIISKDFKPLSREEHTKVGFIDVFGHDNKGNLIIVECKRYTAGMSAVTQLQRYVDKIEELKGLKGKNCVKGFMASPAISPNALAWLKERGHSWKKVEPPMRLEKASKNQAKLDEF